MPHRVVENLRISSCLRGRFVLEKRPCCVGRHHYSRSVRLDSLPRENARGGDGEAAHSTRRRESQAGEARARRARGDGRRADRRRPCAVRHAGDHDLAEAIRVAQIASPRVAAGLSDDLIVNVQGDEPEISPATIDALIAKMQRTATRRWARSSRRFPSRSIRTIANVVKAVLAEDGRAVYFSRSPVPFRRMPLPKTRRRRIII